MKNIRLSVVVLLLLLLLANCVSCLPRPSNAQILAAVQTANRAEEKPLELVYEEMQVPYRNSGQAHAVLWVTDKSIQRNYTLAYDRQTAGFYVTSHITLILGEDGVYRQQPD